MNFSSTAARHTPRRRNFKTVLGNARGAIDLASIMAGVLVIGIIGGTISATVFAVIPWSQDAAAQDDLQAVLQAENLYHAAHSGYGTLSELQAPATFASGSGGAVGRPGASIAEPIAVGAPLLPAGGRIQIAASTSGFIAASTSLTGRVYYLSSGTSSVSTVVPVVAGLVAPGTAAPAGSIPAVTVSYVSTTAGWDSAAVQYNAPSFYAMYSDVAQQPGMPAGPDRTLAGLRVRVAVPAALVTAAQPVLGASNADLASNWTYLGASIVGSDQVFDYAYSRTLVVTAAGPSPQIFGFPMTFARQAGAVGSGSVTAILTSSNPFSYMANGGLPTTPGAPPDRCSLANAAVTCRTDLTIG